MRQVLGKALAGLVVAVSVTTMGAGAAGAEAVGAIGGVVWLDRNENRGWDGAEPPRAGVEVVARNVATGVEYRVVSDRQGGIQFDGLPLGDGVREQGDPLREATFMLVGHSDAEGWVERTVTTVDGSYELMDVASGTYRIRTTSPEGMVATRYRAAGAQWYTDSDFVGASEPVTEPFELPTASYEASVDAGFVLSDAEGSAAGVVE